MFKILVVEDDRDLNRTVCAFLNHSGYEAAGCLNAQDAYDAMYDTMFDLIVSDIMMPGVTGLDAAREIRTFDETAEIVFLTTSPAFAILQLNIKMDGVYENFNITISLSDTLAAAILSYGDE